MEYDFKEPKAYTPPEPMPQSDNSLYLLQDDYLSDRNLSPTTARYNYWYPTELKGPRIIIPCTKGFWQARALEDNTPRYLSAKGSRDGAFCVVWPKYPSDLTVIAEGPMDALAAAGLRAVGVASLGAGFGGYVVDWVCNNRPLSHILIIPDLDNEEFGYSLMAEFTNHGRVATIKHPTKKDLASMTIKQREKLLEE